MTKSFPLFIIMERFYLSCRVWLGLGRTYRSRYFLPKSVLKSLYLALGWSHISYGIVIWGKSSLTYINKIQSLQNKIIKNIFGNHNDETFRSNSLIKFVDAFDYFAGIKLYKELNSSVVPYFSERILILQNKS